MVQSADAPQLTEQHIAVKPDARPKSAGQQVVDQLRKLTPKKALEAMAQTPVGKEITKFREQQAMNQAAEQVSKIVGATDALKFTIRGGDEWGVIIAGEQLEGAYEKSESRDDTQYTEHYNTVPGKNIDYFALQSFMKTNPSLDAMRRFVLQHGCTLNSLQLSRIRGPELLEHNQLIHLAKSQQGWRSEDTHDDRRDGRELNFGHVDAPLGYNQAKILHTPQEVVDLARDIMTGIPKPVVSATPLSTATK